MKVIKKALTLAVALTFSIVCFGCGASDQPSNVEMKEYSNQNNTFSISVSGEWTETPTQNGDHLVLDNDDQTLSILIQKFPREALTLTGIDEFIDVYHKSVISSLIKSSDAPKKEEITIPGVTSAKAEEYVSEQQGVTAKAYVGYIETETAFYSYTITGLEELYDKNVKTLKKSFETFQEK